MAREGETDTATKFLPSRFATTAIDSKVGKKSVKPSQGMALAALVFGSVIAGGFYYVWPYALWWVYPVIALLAAGPAYKTWLEMNANEKIIDRGDWPNAPKRDEAPEAFPKRDDAPEASPPRAPPARLGH